MKSKSEIKDEIIEKYKEIKKLNNLLNTPKFNKFPVRIKKTKESMEAIKCSLVKGESDSEFFTLTGFDGMFYDIKIDDKIPGYCISVHRDDSFQEYK